MILNLTLIQKVIHPNSVVQELVLLLSNSEHTWQHQVWPHLGTWWFWCHPSARTTKEITHLSNPPVPHQLSHYQPWAQGSCSKTHPPNQAVLSSGHDKLCRGNTPNVQSTAACEEGAFVRKPHEWFLKNWRMGKKELPVILRDEDGTWMNAQHTQQICSNIQAGIFIQVQVNSAHKLKKIIEKREKHWMRRQLSWGWWAVDKSTTNDKDSQRHK